MEFKKIPASVSAPQPYVDPDTQMRQNLRLMAKRMLHGARGVLLIVASLQLVTGIAGLLYIQKVTGLQDIGASIFTDRFRGGPADWLVLADLFIALFMLLCGWLIMKSPLFSTLMPVLLLAGKVIASVGVSISSGGFPNIPLTVFQIVLVALGIYTVSEARAYRREVSIAREYFRSTAILRMKESRR